MIQFQDITLDDFLTHYWQKQPLIMRNALPGFVNPISPDELAGLALEDDIESRLVWQTKHQSPEWHLKRGPLNSKDFKNLPQSHWTLLVQGMDKIIPEVAAVLSRFDSIPSWRVDDVMISYATQAGSVGPHYDNYDVFLYQAEGRRQWQLTAQNCTTENCIDGIELRLMKQFDVEQEFILEEGDMLYLPAHIGHYGISLSESCMTYSFGYRSYPSQELWDNFSDYVAEQKRPSTLYRDPNWCNVKGTNEIPLEAVQEAQNLLKSCLDDTALLQQWFGCWATSLDEQAHQLLPNARKRGSIKQFLSALNVCNQLTRDSLCRVAYQKNNGSITLFINGCVWNTDGVSAELIELIANHRFVDKQQLNPFLNNPVNQQFLFDLWTLRWAQLNQ